MSGGLAIYYVKGGLWFAQGQGVCGRQTIGGYVTKEALFGACAQAFGEDVRLEHGEDED